jgi:hypothetical protein
MSYFVLQLFYVRMSTAMAGLAEPVPEVAASSRIVRQPYGAKRRAQADSSFGLERGVQDHLGLAYKVCSMDNGIVFDLAFCMGRYLRSRPLREEDPVQQRKKNEFRTVVIVVIALIIFLLIRRESHFKYQHPSFLSGSAWSPAVVPPS